MELVWSPAVATGNNRWQMGGRPERLNQAKTFAMGCDRLPERAFVPAESALVLYPLFAALLGPIPVGP